MLRPVRPDLAIFENSWKKISYKSSPKILWSFGLFSNKSLNMLWPLFDNFWKHIGYFSFQYLVTLVESFKGLIITADYFRGKLFKGFKKFQPFKYRRADARMISRLKQIIRAGLYSGNLGTHREISRTVGPAAASRKFREPRIRRWPI